MEPVEREGKKTYLHPALVLGILAAGLVIGLLIPVDGISWMLSGFQEYRFTVGEEQISLRLDTSGVGPYEVECRDNRISVTKQGTVLWEGGFFARDVCAAYQRDALEAEDCRILEDMTEESPALICSYPDSGGTGYALMTQVDGAACGAVFHTPEGGSFSEQEALDYAHRLHFTKLEKVD